MGNKLFNKRLFGTTSSGSGSDQHNLGYYATPAALRTAHPTATQGDWAIVGSTDTVWVWDVEGNDWKDTGESISIDDITITQNAQNKIQTVGIIDQNSNYDKVWSGTLAEYNAISTKDANTIYFVSGGDGYNIQVYSMPTASSSYENIAVQYLGTTTSDYEQGLWYICEENPTDTWNWVNLLVDPIATASNFGLVKVDNSSIIANSGVISANKATGNYSVSFVGNPATTTSALNVGANSTAHGWYATALGCDAVVGDSANDVRTAGAIQLGRGSNTEAGTFKVGLSTNGTAWNNYTLLDNTGKIPSDRMLGTATITDSTTTTLANNTVYTGSSLTSVTIAYPATVTSTFASQVDFTTGSSITFAIDSGTVMKGDDCSSDVFTPVASASYSILFSYSNSTKTGIVMKIA